MEKGDPGERLFLLCDSKNSDYAWLYPESLSEAGFKSHWEINFSEEIWR